MFRFKALMEEHFDELVQMVVTITSPTGRVVNSSMPTQATPMSARPTQTPVPSSRNRTKRNRMMIEKSSMALLPVALLDQIGLDPVVAGKQHVDQMVGQRDRQDHGADDHRHLRDPER